MTMHYQQIHYSVDEHIATITLNRPEVLNAYTPDMGDEIVAAFRTAEKDDSVRAVILTGAGERGFCAGADRVYLQNPLPAGTRLIGEEALIRSYPLELANFPKPTIAALNGHAIGIGMTMILPLDMRVAADHAKLSLNFTKLGIMPGLGSTHLLPKIVGIAKAQELLMTARTVTAREAADMGLVNYVVPADKLMTKARELALLCAECSAVTQKYAKRALHYGASVSLEEAFAHEQRAVELLRAEQNHRDI
ncbi:MAG TPA: enoyl-CoA hydratase/isomerase family protein [Pseudomonadales bacterium]|nr:enoyl-CoA hydratase/isomerase family protein [Pseudomonadales bacterium]HNN86112.1 enoyl-CoA hydratase/isomerase family protein [Pseudomonadales bacterium]